MTSTPPRRLSGKRGRRAPSRRADRQILMPKGLADEGSCLARGEQTVRPLWGTVRAGPAGWSRCLGAAAVLLPGVRAQTGPATRRARDMRPVWHGVPAARAGPALL